MTRKVVEIVAVGCRFKCGVSFAGNAADVKVAIEHHNKTVHGGRSEPSATELRKADIESGERELRDEEARTRRWKRQQRRRKKRK